MMHCNNCMMMYHNNVSNMCNKIIKYNSFYSYCDESNLYKHTESSVFTCHLCFILLPEIFDRFIKYTSICKLIHHILLDEHIGWIIYFLIHNKETNMNP